MKITEATVEDFYAAVRKNGRPNALWPFRDMEVDQVLIIKHEYYSPTQIQRKAHKYASLSGKKFTCKSSEKGVYVKRIA